MAVEPILNPRSHFGRPEMESVDSCASKTAGQVIQIHINQRIGRLMEARFNYVKAAGTAL